MHKNMELVRTMKKTKSHYWQVQGRQRGLQFQMEGCKQKKKPKRGTARGKEKGKKMMNAVGRKKTTRETDKALRNRTNRPVVMLRV